MFNLQDIQDPNEVMSKLPFAINIQRSRSSLNWRRRILEQELNNFEEASVQDQPTPGLYETPGFQLSPSPLPEELTPSFGTHYRPEGSPLFGRTIRARSHLHTPTPHPHEPSSDVKPKPRPKTPLVSISQQHLHINLFRLHYHYHKLYHTLTSMPWRHILTLILLATTLTFSATLYTLGPRETLGLVIKDPYGINGTTATVMVEGMRRTGVYVNGKMRFTDGWRHPVEVEVDVRGKPRETVREREMRREREGWGRFVEMGEGEGVREPVVEGWWARPAREGESGVEEVREMEIN
ncbi:hypothetical protein EX30DRAFT_349787 [Ascodesmis nigricans]|uniref:Uncharacterized protein n=1 Tax=Ascodesmis nigricans TaxID=341454 RepID=A0A4S2MU76_9PEZI|nr:hypothetical protein EX30DRAFT_349787 [Ascodesmis nigricans]